MKADYNDNPIKWPDDLPKVRNPKMGEVRLSVPCPHAIGESFFGYEDHYQINCPLILNNVQAAFASAGFPVSVKAGWIWKVWFKCDQRVFGSPITFILAHERYVELIPSSRGLGLVSDPVIGVLDWLKRTTVNPDIERRFRAYGKPHDWGHDFKCKRCGGILSEGLALNSDCEQ